jgi:signal transduction histidine kinase/DNA-binding NarL/FixJ family response regulator/HPt (histidine-containing phosphotransfer) domain-containing protein
MIKNCIRSLPCIALFFAFGVHAQDQHFFDSLHTAYAAATQDTDRSDILLKLATSLADADTATAMSYAQQSLYYAERARDARRAARYELFAAHQFSNAGMYDSARGRLERAVHNAETLGDSTMLANAYSQLGWNDLEVGSYHEALDYFLKQLDVVLHSRDTAGIGNSYNNIGCLYIDQQEIGSALKNLRLALTFSAHGKDLRAQAAIYNNLGLSFNGRNGLLPYDRSLDSALAYFRKSEALYAQSGEEYLRARVLGNIGGVFEKKGNLDSALWYDRQSVYLHETVGLSSTYAAGAYAQLGNLFLVLKQSDSVFHYLNRAREIDERLGAKRGLTERYLSLSKAYAEKGDFKQAYEYLQKGNALHDSLYGVDKSRILADMEAKYQTSKNERKIATQNEEIKRQRIVNYAIIGFAIVLALVIGLIYRNERQLKRINKELAAAKERAEASELLEHQFLANMSHEIRTPMNAVLGMSNLLLDMELTQKQRDYLEAIQTSADNLLVVINDILDLSKLQAGKMELEQIPFRLRDVIGQVFDLVHIKAESKGIGLVQEISESSPAAVVGDPARLTQILTNLVSNAVKFTDKGSVTVRTTAVAAGERTMMVRIAVHDTGIGIAPEKQKTIFDSFSQADAETTRKYGGTGLGLTISRTLVELMGGNIGVTSELGKGAEFFVTIPYEVVAEETLVEPERTIRLDAASLHGLRVMLVEDNEYNQIVLGDTLRSMIPEVMIEIASNGRQAIALLQAYSFDLILMDVQMPEMDGIEATQYIRTHFVRSKRDIPIVALTASVIKSEIDRCLAAGMNDYVPKPFKQDELFRVIGKYYRRKQPVPAANPTPVASTFPLHIPAMTPPIAAGPATPSQNGTANAAPIADLSSLAQITGGDDAQLKKYIRMFLDGVPGQLESIAAAIGDKDYDNTRRRIHAMKPHLKFMGMTAAAGFAESIEQLCAEQKGTDKVEEHFAEVRRMCEQAFIELKAKL